MKVRARYRTGSSSNGPWSGPWTEKTVSIADVPQPIPTPTPVASPTPTPTPEPLSTPTIGSMELPSLVAVSESPEDITVSWEEPADRPDDYRVQWAVAGEDFASWSDTTTNVFSTVLSHTFTDMAEGEEYRIRARARYSSQSKSGPWRFVSVTVNESDDTSTEPETDTDQVTVSFASATYSATEGGPDATVTLLLSKPSPRRVEIPLTATAGAGATEDDWTGIPDSLAFEAGETSNSFTVEAVDDMIEDSGKLVIVALGDLPADFSPGSPATATITLLNDEGTCEDDSSPITVRLGAASYSVDEEDATLLIPVVLSRSARSVLCTLRIPITVTHNGGATWSDFYGPTGATFWYAYDETTLNLRYSVVHDLVDDDGESVTVAIDTSALGARFSVGTPSTATVTINDDDEPITQSRYEVDALSPYWLDNGRNGNTLTLNSCRFSCAFRVIWNGPMSAQDQPDTWEADITGDARVSYSVRQSPGGEEDEWELNGTARMDGPGIFSIRVQGIWGSDNGPWSPAVSLFCV